jgi:hypothetical protein
MKSLFKPLMLLSICLVGVMFASALAFGHRLLSPRALGIVLLISCIAFGVAAVLTVKKSSREFMVPPRPPRDIAIDAVTRAQLLRRIRLAQIIIVIMGAALVVGLTEIKDGPILPLLVGVVLNLLIIGRSIHTIVQSKKILN